MNGSTMAAVHGGALAMMHHLHRHPQRGAITGSGPMAANGNMLHWLNWNLGQRQEKAAELIASHAPCTVLQLGAGGGRLIPVLLEAGAVQVHAIETTDRLVTIGRKLMREMGAAADVTWQMAPFLDPAVEGEYDITIAVDAFDMLDDPRPVLAKARRMTLRVLAASFLARGPRFHRRGRLSVRGMSMHRTYSRDEVDSMMSESGWTDWDIVRLGQVWFVIARS